MTMLRIPCFLSLSLTLHKPPAINMTAAKAMNFTELPMNTASAMQRPVRIKAVISLAPENENLPKIAEALKAMGVREKVIIHKPDCAACLSDEGLSALPSYALPSGYIKGTTGAGDAFCAGALVGLYEGWDDLHILELASACAVMALGAADATSGLKTQEEIVAFCSQFGRKA